MEIIEVLCGKLKIIEKRFKYEIPITGTTHAVGGLFLYCILHNNSHLKNL